jgi:tetratricopeptide (TPR) repeat protein
MRCTLSKVKKSEASHKSSLTHRLCGSLIVLSILVLCAWVPGARAQALVTGNGTGGSISGTVYLPGKGGVASQVAVSLKSQDAGVFRSVLTDYDGHFEISGLPRGVYEICVEEAGYETLKNNAKLEGPALTVELHLIATTPQPPPNAYTISVRELSIPEKAHEEFNRGLESLAKKDFAMSLKHFTKAIEKFPGYFEAFYHQGVAHTNLGQLEKAMQAFQKCIDLSGGRYARGDFGIGYILYLQGKASEAESVIRKGLEVDGNSADGFLVLGMTQLRENRPEDAEKSAREALLRDPKMANAYLVLADSFARRRNYREQIQDLDAYLRLDPTGTASARAHAIREAALKILAESQPQN